MRFPNSRRVIVSIFIIPLFVAQLIINRVCETIDLFLFPKFKNQKILKPVFIISAARSGTTLLFNYLYMQSSKFTCIKLWEILIAPSITQKYIFLGIRKVDKIFGSPIYGIIKYIDGKSLCQIKVMHPCGLFYPEEDDSILIWRFSSAFLSFFYPDTDLFDDLFLFDRNLNSNNRNKIMKIYYRYIQRHNYVFNRGNKKLFLSKNVLMMSKLSSLQQYFPDLRVIQINRCPKNTYPSTIELLKQFYKIFTSKNFNNRTREKIINQLTVIHIMAHEHKSKYDSTNLLEIDFRYLISESKLITNNIDIYLKLDIDNTMDIEKIKPLHKSIKTCDKLTRKEESDISSQIAFMEKYC